MLAFEQFEVGNPIFDREPEKLPFHIAEKNLDDQNIR